MFDVLFSVFWYGLVLLIWQIAIFFWNTYFFIIRTYLIWCFGELRNFYVYTKICWIMKNVLLVEARINLRTFKGEYFLRPVSIYITTTILRLSYLVTTIWLDFPIFIQRLPKRGLHSKTHLLQKPPVLQLPCRRSQIRYHGTYQCLFKLHLIASSMFWRPR